MRTSQQIQASSAGADKLGFFGKMPSRGDFLSDSLDRDLIEIVDGWLQEGMQTAKQHFGPRWETIFQSSVPWHFIVEKGIWGPCTYAGVMLPSRDRVGRGYPFVLMAKLHAYSDPPRALYGDRSWFTAMEGLAESIHSREFDLEQFRAAMQRLRLPKPDRLDLPQQTHERPAASLMWCIDPYLREPRGIQVKGPLTAQDFLKLFQFVERVENQDQDPPSSNSSLTAGAKKGPSHAPVPPPETAASRMPMEDAVRGAEPRPEPPEVKHAGLALVCSHDSHPGIRHNFNADAIFADPTRGIFALADGIGEAPRSAEAARLTAHSLSEVSNVASTGEMLRDMRGKLGAANSLLLPVTGVQDGRPVPAASVAAVLVKDGSYHVLWAGDVRAYLVEHGTMRALTRDHLGVGIRSFLQRGIGLEMQLRPETVSGSFSDQSRLLLCSQPLVRSLGERTIAVILLETPLEEAAARLVQEALIANAVDNVTALVIGPAGGTDA